MYISVILNFLLVCSFQNVNPPEIDPLLTSPHLKPLRILRFMPCYLSTQETAKVFESARKILWVSPSNTATSAFRMIFKMTQQKGPCQSTASQVSFYWYHRTCLNSKLLNEYRTYIYKPRTICATFCCVFTERLKALLVLWKCSNGAKTFCIEF